MNNIEYIKERTISSKATVIEALQLMGAINHKMLFVYDDEQFVGILTIGNIQRAIIKNSNLSLPVTNILEKQKIYASPFDPIEKTKEVMYRLRIECMPVVDSDGSLKDIILWNDLFGNDEIPEREKIELPVVIMAGGKGTRLKPITNVIPKPLIPVGDKTILEEIMNQFEKMGSKQFYMSVNYKGDMMRFYLDQLPHKYMIEFFEEDKPLGTIGSVSLLKGKITTPFFVTNCDIIIDQDYRDVYYYHQDNHNDITIVTAVKSFRIPYGVIETGDGGIMTGLKEKPETTYMINTGVYILNPNLIDEIPEGEFFHITHLMEKVKARGGRVGCFPVGEKAWRDMGEWPEYLKMINVL